MQTTKWNVAKAARNGAVLGAPLLLVRGLLLGDAMPQMPELIGYLLGGVIGGVILFAAAAAVANLFIR